MKMFTIDNEIENRIKENKAKTISEKRISPQVVRIKMEISILELRRERLDEEIKELKIKLRQVEKREKST
jgi:hypothetical protein